MRRMTFLRTCVLLVAMLGVAGTANAVITFDEYPLGTIISNQYAAQGVLFLPGNITKRLPQLSMDWAMPTEPVLRPTGEPDYYEFRGDFWMECTVPNTTYVEFDSGFWNTPGEAVINVYDPSMNPLASLSNVGTGVEKITISGLGPIGYIYFNSIADVTGADIDNLVIPAPGAILLGSIGVGLVGWLRRRKSL